MLVKLIQNGLLESRKGRTLTNEERSDLVLRISEIIEASGASGEISENMIKKIEGELKAADIPYGEAMDAWSEANKLVSSQESDKVDKARRLANGLADVKGVESILGVFEKKRRVGINMQKGIRDFVAFMNSEAWPLVREILELANDKIYLGRKKNGHLENRDLFLTRKGLQMETLCNIRTTIDCSSPDIINRLMRIMSHKRFEIHDRIGYDYEITKYILHKAGKLAEKIEKKWSR